MFLKGSKSSKDAKGLVATAGVNVAGLAMAGAEEKEDIPKGSLLVVVKSEETGAINGLLLFSGTGELFLSKLSLGGKAGGGATRIGPTGAGATTVGAVVDSVARGSNSSSFKSSSVKLSNVMPPKST